MKYLIIGIIAMVIIAIIIVVVILTRKKSSNTTCSKQNPNGSCPSGQSCQNGECVCTPNCSGKTCGDDGCGGSCGECPSGSSCQNGQCVAPSGQGFICTTTGCEQGCSLENYRDKENYDATCYTSQESCQMSCTEAPCSAIYPNGVCPGSDVCVGGACIPSVSQNCPYPNSTLVAPQGLPDGTYSISYNGTELAGVVQAVLWNALPPGITWNYQNNTLIMNKMEVVPSCQLESRDECYKTNCGNPADGSYPSNAPSGVVYCSQTIESGSPQHFILGKDFIYSIDARAYLIPDARPGTTTPCVQGTSPGVVTITYTTDESRAHVWTVSSVS